MSLYQEIYSNRKLRKALHKLDFEIVKLNLRGSKSNLTKDTSSVITTFARDATGGYFAFWGGEDESVVYISSEGGCGRFASCLEQALLFIVTFPFSWMDLLHTKASVSYMKEIIKRIEAGHEKELDPNSDEGKYYQEIGFDVAFFLRSIDDAANIVSDELQIGKGKSTLQEFCKEKNRKPYYIAVAADGVEYEQLWQ